MHQAAEIGQPESEENKLCRAGSHRGYSWAAALAIFTPHPEGDLDTVSEGDVPVASAAVW